jgi:hypothetical protein
MSADEVIGSNEFTGFPPPRFLRRPLLRKCASESEAQDYFWLNAC